MLCRKERAMQASYVMSRINGSFRPHFPKSLSCIPRYQKEIIPTSQLKSITMVLDPCRKLSLQSLNPTSYVQSLSLHIHIHATDCTYFVIVRVNKHRHSKHRHKSAAKIRNYLDMVNRSIMYSGINNLSF